jgi:hypothetical protein
LTLFESLGTEEAGNEFLTKNELSKIYEYNGTLKKDIIPVLQAIKENTFSVGDVLNRYSIDQFTQKRDYDSLDQLGNLKKMYRVVYIDSYGLVFVKAINESGKPHGKPLCISYTMNKNNGYRYELDDSYQTHVLFGQEFDAKKIAQDYDKQIQAITEYNKSIEVKWEEMRATLAKSRVMTFLKDKKVGDFVYFKFYNHKFILTSTYAGKVNNFFYFKLKQKYHKLDITSDILTFTPTMMTTKDYLIFYKSKPKGIDETS